MVSLREVRKSTQRARLLRGMMEMAVQHGYAGATVARVIGHAGVSRPTFYEYFDNRLACFMAVHRVLAAELVESVRAAVNIAEPARSVNAAIEALAELATTEPVAARFLLHEAATAGDEALDERDSTIAELVRAIDRARAKAPPQKPTPDVFTPALIGGVYRLLSLRLRRGERNLTAVADELDTWLTAYGRPTREHRWRTLGTHPAAAPSRFVPPAPAYPTSPLPDGATLPVEELRRNHRERLMFACIRAANLRGYQATTIADVVEAAHVDRRMFYRLFEDKHEAFQATIEHVFQQSLAATAAGFFSAPTWPERVWEGGRAFAEFFAANPALAQFAFIDVYAIGPTAVDRVDDMRAAHTIFLHEGRQRPRKGHAAPTATALDAIAATVFEAAYHQVRQRRTGRLASLLPDVAHLCLTPFQGRRATDKFIRSRLVSPGKKK